MKTSALVLVALFLTACGKAEGEPCNAAQYEECGSGFDSESSSCVACPAEKGFSSVQGVCTTDLHASESACLSAWGGTTGGGGDCNNAWTCAYDGQASPLCMAACTYTGTQRTQTCQVLASYMTSGNAGECCTACR